MKLATAKKILTNRNRLQNELGYSVVKFMNTYTKLSIKERELPYQKMKSVFLSKRKTSSTKPASKKRKSKKRSTKRKSKKRSTNKQRFYLKESLYKVFFILVICINGR
jgi:hypothetical protein